MAMKMAMIYDTVFRTAEGPKVAGKAANRLQC
jgi:hypothetical protein